MSYHKIDKYLDGYGPLLMKAVIFAIDNDKLMLKGIERKFKDVGLTDYKTFFDPDILMKELTKDVRVAVIDYYLDDGKLGIELMDKICDKNPQCKFIFLSAQGDSNVIIDICNSGAYYIMKDEMCLEKLVYFIDKIVRSWDRAMRDMAEALKPLKNTIKALENFKSAQEDYEGLSENNT